jgi:putative ABC transport system permease protein
MILTIAQATLSHWKRHPGQLLSLVIGLALATALWSGVQAINAEARASYDSAAQSLGQSTLEVLEPVSPGPLPQTRFVKLRRAGWLVSPVLEGRYRLGDGTIRISGYDPLTAPVAMQPVDLTVPKDLAGFISGTVGFAHPETLAGLELSETDLEIYAQATLPLGILLVDIGTAQRLLDQHDALSHLVLWPDQPVGLESLIKLAPDLRRVRPSQTSDAARLTDSFHLNLTAFGLLAFAVGLFIVHGAIGLAFEQRRAMFRTLRAVGVPLRSLVIVLASEIIVLAMISAFVGVALGYVIAATLLPDVAATIRGLYGAEVTGNLQLRSSWWLSGLGIALAGAAVASAQALWRVSKMPLLAPAQPRAWLRASFRGITIQLGVAMGLFLIAWLSVQYFSGLIAGFIMLGSLLLGAALILPGVLSALLNMASRLSARPLTQWFWADTQQQLPGLSLALMALMLALATNIGVGTMVSSFRLTFTGWLDQRLASEFYVTGRDQEEAGALLAFLEPRSDAVLPIWRVEGALNQHPGEVFAVADHPTYRDNWPMLRAVPDIWDLLANGEGVLINEQLWRRDDLSLGDTLTLPDGPDLQIIGVFSDYGNPKAQAIIGLSVFDRVYPNAARLGFAVRIDPEKVSQLRADIREEFDLPDTLMIDQASIKSFSLGVFERTFAVSGALNILTLGVAGFAMLTSLLTLASMRIPQLAPVWALGQTRARLAQFELLRAVLLAGLTTVVAIPVGLVLAWSLLAVVNVEAFGWRLPMFLFPSQWLVLGGLTLLAAVLAALWPAQKLARTPPGDLLKVFANER